MALLMLSDCKTVGGGALVSLLYASTVDLDGEVFVGTGNGWESPRPNRYRAARSSAFIRYLTALGCGTLTLFGKVEQMSIRRRKRLMKRVRTRRRRIRRGRNSIASEFSLE